MLGVCYLLQFLVYVYFLLYVVNLVQACTWFDGWMVANWKGVMMMLPHLVLIKLFFFVSHFLHL